MNTYRALTDSEACALETGARVFTRDRGAIVGPWHVAYGWPVRTPQHVMLCNPASGQLFEQYAMDGCLLIEEDKMSTDERLASLAVAWRETQVAEESAREALAAAAREAAAGGMSAYRIGKITYAASDTVAKWLKT